MILGADHVALSCEDVASASGVLAQAGYRARFLERDLPNPPAKRAFLGAYHPRHSLAYCEGPGGAALELTEHGGALPDAASPYQVLLGAAPPETRAVDMADSPWVCVWQEAFGCRRPRAALWSPLRAQFWHDSDAGGAATGVRALLVPVADVARAQEFWLSAMGCGLVAEGRSEAGPWVRVAFRAPVPQWSLDVILAEGDGQPGSSLLDAAGFPCLGLLSTNVPRDSDRMRQAGAREGSGEFHVEINGKTLRIAVVRGPDGELLELIQYRG